LFSSAFKNTIKNYKLANKALSFFPNVKVHELSGHERQDVNYLMNACDALLVTSLKESGPLVVKEAMGCNLPVVSTDVGDVRDVIKETSGCYLTSYSINDVVKNLRKAMNFKGRTNGRKNIQHLSLENIAKAHIMIYRKILSEKDK
jgi:glycosyltransferase involved in cell wall biosynthesis